MRNEKAFLAMVRRAELGARKGIPIEIIARHEEKGVIMFKVKITKEPYRIFQAYWIWSKSATAFHKYTAKEVAFELVKLQEQGYHIGLIR